MSLETPGADMRRHVAVGGKAAKKARGKSVKPRRGAKTARRQAQREAGRKPRGPEPQAPSSEPKGSDQVNLTDEESRIMPGSSGGFAQSYNEIGRAHV